MIVLALLSLLLYKNILGLLVFVMRVRFERIGESDRIERRMKELTPNRSRNWETYIARRKDAQRRFRYFVQSRLKYTSALIVAAPLLGLMGTVFGLLGTFQGLTSRLGQETLLLVTEGIKRALITTETGLLIAIPALFLIYWIRRVSKRRELELMETEVLEMRQAEQT